jgi:small multidrug resistance family-3 protein
MTAIAWVVFIAAAVLEVGGDAVVRKGLRGSSLWFIICGFSMLGLYGLVVNMVKWDFSRLLGVYVAVFAVVSVLTGRFIFKETVPISTWLGLAIIVAGGTVIQMGTGR